MVERLQSKGWLHSEGKKQMLDASEILAKYHRTILKTANKFCIKNPRFDIEDLVEEGRLAAINAANSFDPKKETKFITYLTNALNFELQKFVGDNAYDLEVSEYFRRKEFKEHGSTDRLKNETRAIRLDVSTEDCPGDSQYRSLNTFHNVLPSGEPNPEEAMIRAENIQVLREEMNKLPERERVVLELRFLEGLTLREIAFQMNVTKQTIHGWQKKGFERLQRKVKTRLGHELF